MPSLGLGLGLHKTTPLFNGLLDYYGGAAAAYSLRALSRGWLAGDVVKVRRSSFGGGPAELEFTASDITSGAMLSWVTEFSGTADGFVSTWYDQSGNANNATQITTTAQPKIVDAGSLVTGGLEFDGVDDVLSTGVSVAGVYTSFAVNTYKGSGSTIVYGRGDGLSRHTLNNSGGIKTSLFCGGTAAVEDSGDATIEHLSTAFFDGATKEDNRVAFNGNALSSTGASNSGTEVLNSLTIGAELSAVTLHGNSLVKEIILYPSDEQSNIDSIRANINSFYSIY